MRVIQARVRCVEGIEDSGWFVPARETTLFHGSSASSISQLFRALEALNPLYAIDSVDPFADHPEIWGQEGLQRRVIPAKKTAVCLVFAAEANLVRVLDLVDSHLIETNRIEVGRRLDYSRWMTFVEISASTRWSEIEEPMREIRARLQDETDASKPVADDSFFDRLIPTDRLKGETAEQCRRWLLAAARRLGDCQRSPMRRHRLLQRCLYGVGRAERFQLARRVVEQWLPPSILLTPGHRLRPEYRLEAIMAGAADHDPVLALLALLVRRYRLDAPEDGGGAAFAKAVELARACLVSSLPSEMRYPLPEPRADRLRLAATPPANELEERLLLLATVCLLAKICWGHLPLLLLDRFDAGLPAADLPRLVAVLKNLGVHCQLFAATEYREVAENEAWQKVMTVGPQGAVCERTASSETAG